MRQIEFCLLVILSSIEYGDRKQSQWRRASRSGREYRDRGTFFGR